MLSNIIPQSLRLRLVERPVLRKIMANAGWLFADKVVRLGTGLFIVAWTARYLGTGSFGLLNYAIALVTLFSVISSLGLDQIVVRDIVRHPDDSNEILGTAFALKLSGALLVLPLTLVTASWLHPQEDIIVYMTGVIALGTVFQAFNVFDFWFQAQMQSKFTVYAMNAAFLIASAAKVAAILLKASLLVFALLVLAERILYALGMFAVYRGNGRCFKTLSFSFARAKTLFSDSWPLFLSGMAIVIYVKIGQIMLEAIVGSHAVGLYAAAAQISEVWYFIPTAIVASSFPSIITAKTQSKELYYRRLRKLFNALCLLAYSLAIPMTFMSKYIIRALFGAQFESAAAILSIHIWASPFVFLGMARGSWIITEGLMKFAMLSTISGAVINVLLNLILIPKYSGIGAAIATVISYAFSVYISCFLYYRTRGVGMVMTKSILFPFSRRFRQNAAIS